MSGVLVDSNVLLDVLTEDPRWFGWSADVLARCADESGLVINPIVYAEVSVGFDRIEDVESALPQDVFVRSPLPWDAALSEAHPDRALTLARPGRSAVVGPTS